MAYKDRGYGTTIDNYKAQQEKKRKEEEAKKLTLPKVETPQRTGTATGRASSTYGPPAPSANKLKHHARQTTTAPGTATVQAKPIVNAPVSTQRFGVNAPVKQQNVLSQTEFDRSPTLRAAYKTYDNYVAGTMTTGGGFSHAETQDRSRELGHLRDQMTAYQAGLDNQIGRVSQAGQRWEEAYNRNKGSLDAQYVRQAVAAINANFMGSKDVEDMSPEKFAAYASSWADSVRENIIASEMENERARKDKIDESRSRKTGYGTTEYISSDYVTRADAMRDYLREKVTYDKMARDYGRTAGTYYSIIDGIQKQEEARKQSVRPAAEIEAEATDIESQIAATQKQLSALENETNFNNAVLKGYNFLGLGDFFGPLDQGQTTAGMLENVMNGQETIDRLQRRLDVLRQYQALLAEEMDMRQYYDWQDVANSTPVSTQRYGFEANASAVTKMLDRLINGTATEEDILTAINEYNLNPNNIDQMSDAEKETYEKIKHAVGPEKAAEYVRYLEKASLNTRRRTQEEADIRKFADEHPWGASALTVLASPAKVFSYVGQGADMLFDGEMEKDASYNYFSYAPAAARSQVGQNIIKWGRETGNKWAEKWGDFGYQTAMSMADFLFNTAITGGFGLDSTGIQLYEQGVRSAQAINAWNAYKASEAFSLGLMGTEAAADAVMQAKDRGLSDGQAFFMGTMAGAIEVLTEKFSVENLMEGLGNKNKLLYFLKNVVAEGSEEAASDIANLIVDNLVAKDQSEFRQSVNAFMREHNVSRREALKAVWMDQLKQTGLSALGGGISGGFMAGMQLGRTSGADALGSFANNYIVNRNQITSAEYVNSLIQQAQALDKSTYGYKFAERLQAKLDSGEKFTVSEVLNARKYIEDDIRTSEKHVREVVDAAKKYADTTEQAEKLEAKLDGGREINLDEVVELEEALYTERVVDPKSKSVQRSIEQGLVSDENSEAYQLSKHMQDKIAGGKKLSVVEVAAAQNAVDESIGKDMRSKSAAVIGKRLAAESGYETLKHTAEYLAGTKNGSQQAMSEQLTAQIESGKIDTEFAGKAFLEARKLQAAARKNAAFTRNLKPREVTADMDEYDASAARAGVSEQEAAWVKSVAQLFGTNTKYRWEANEGERYVVNGKGERVNKAEGEKLNADEKWVTNIENGREENGIVYLNAYSADPVMQVLAHEVTHTLENTEAYRDMKDMILRIMRQDGTLAQQTRKIEQAYRNKSYDLEHELVAFFVQNRLLTDENTIRDTVQKNRSFGEWIRDTLDKVLAKLGNQDAQTRQQLRQARDLWAKALEETRRNEKTASRETGKLTLPSVENKENPSTDGWAQMAFSESEDYSSAVEQMETISDDEYLEAIQTAPFIHVMDHTPAALLVKSDTFKDRPLIIRRDALYLAVRKSGIQKGNYHNLGAEIMKQLPKYLSSPDVILQTDNGRRAALVSMPTKTGQGIISVEFESLKDIGSRHDYYNIVITAFDLKQRYLRNLFTKYGAYIVDMKEDLAQVNPKLYEWLGSINAKSSSEKTIAQQEQDVKAKNSYSLTLPKAGAQSSMTERDVTDYAAAVERGDMETAQRLVDEAARRAGYPLKVMHGTNSFGFTSVDFAKGDDGISFWATDSEEQAGSYVRPMDDEDTEPTTYVRSIGRPVKNRVSMDSTAGEILAALQKINSVYNGYSVATEEQIKQKQDETLSVIRDAGERLDRYSLPNNLNNVAQRAMQSNSMNEALSIWDEIKDIHEITVPGLGIWEQPTAAFENLKAHLRYLNSLSKCTPENTAVSNTSRLALVDKNHLYDMYLDNTGLSGRGIYEIYATENNPLRINCRGNRWNNIQLTGEMAESLGDRATTREIAKWANEHGYGTVIFENVKDTGKYGSQFTSEATVYAFLESGDNSFKSADPITYDDNGNVIPLDQRFNPEKKDIRYSQSETEDLSLPVTAETATKDLRKEGFNVSDGAVAYNLTTLQDSDVWNDKQKVAKQIAKAIGISQKKAKRYIESVQNIGRIIADDRGRLDYDSAKGLSAYVSNAEYGGSFDYTTLCTKRRFMTGTISAIQRNFAAKGLTSEEFLTIRKMLEDAGYQVSCPMCYVEGSRTKLGEYAEDFIKDHAGVTVSQLTDPVELEKLRTEQPEIYSQWESYLSELKQRKPKMYQARTAYDGEIIKNFKDADDVRQKNLNGGIRFQSFSDFEAVHLLDNMQAITDMARVGLAGQAYTKMIDYVMSMGGTGLKINMSLVAKGVDANGSLVLDETGGMTWDEVNRARTAYSQPVDGMDEDTRKALQKSFSQNVGTIIVVFDDAQLRAAMADDRIDFIIPYHRSQWAKAQHYKMGMPLGSQDYTAQQNERTIKDNGKPGKRTEKNLLPNEYWNPRKDGKWNAENYLRLCAEQHIVPKFAAILQDNGDGSYSLQPNGSTDGYWKLLSDYKMYDNEGKFAPQKAVQPLFDTAVLEDILEREDGSHKTYPVADEVVQKFLALKETKGGGEVTLDDYVGKDRAAALRSEYAQAQKDIPSNKKRGPLWLQEQAEHAARFQHEGAQRSITEREDTEGNLGYHAGDLGKAEYLNRQGRGRGTGHFGTGTYFVGTKEKVTEDSHYGKRPQHAVDFSDYNLYKVRNDRDGYRLHDALRVIDGGLDEDFVKKAEAGKFSALRYSDWYDLAKEKFGEDYYKDENQISALTDYANQNGIEIQSKEEFLKANSGIDEEDANYYYLDYLKETVEKAVDEVNDEYHKVIRAIDDLEFSFHFDRPKIIRALNAVLAYQKATPRNSRSDSYATVFMKAMGYDGVDVRGTGLDNTGYGSVIYDVKKDTIRYSRTESELIDSVIDPKETARAGVEDAMDRYLDSIGAGSDIPGMDKISTGTKRNAKLPARYKAREAARFFYRKMVDSGEAVTRLGRYSNDPHLYHYYNMARASSNAAVSMIQDAQTDVMGRRVGDSLNDIFSSIRKKGEQYYADLQAYLYHTHNIDRMSRENPGAVAGAQAELEQFRRDNPELVGMADFQIERLANDPISFYHDQARAYTDILRRLRNAAMTHNKPVFGQDVSAEQSRQAAEQLREKLEKTEGFEEDVEKIYAYIDNLMQYRIDSGLITEEEYERLKEIYPHYVPTFREQEPAARNKRGNTTEIGKTVGRAQGGDTRLIPLHRALAQQTFSVVREGSKNRFGQMLLEGKQNSSRGMIKNVEEAESGFHEDTFDEEDVTPKKENTFIVRQDGKRYEIGMDNALYESVTALSPEPAETNFLINMVHKSNDLFKALCTGYNPTFLVRNFMRDLQDAGLYSKDLSEFSKNYPLAYKEITTNGKYWQMYKALGGLYSSFFDYQTGELKQPGKVKKYTIDAIESVNMAVEQAPRLAEFMATVKKAEKAGNLSMDTLMEAIYNAADVTVNFGRSGKWGKMFNRSVVPFFNPGVQGFDKMIRNVTETKGFKDWARLAAKATILGIAPAVISRLLFGKRKDWDEIKQRDKDIYYLFPLQDGVWLKLPKGRVLSVFGMAADRVMQGKDADWASFIETSLTQTAPENPLTASYWRPWLDAKLFDKDDPGKTWYGSDIENQRLRNLAPGQRYDTTTDALSKWLGKKFGLSPKKINYLLDQYSGVIGDVLLPLTSDRAEKGLFTNAFTIDSVVSNQLSEDFYDMKDRLTWAKNDPNATGEDEALYKYWNQQTSAISDINKAIRAIEQDKTLTDKEKRDLTRVQYSLRNGIMRNALDSMSDYRAGGTDNDIYPMVSDAQAQEERESKVYSFKGQTVFWDDLSGTQKKIVQAQDALKDDPDADLSEIIGKGNATKKLAQYQAARDQGISNQTYIDALQAIDDADDGNGNYNQAEAKAGLDKLISDGTISEKEAGTLWKIITGGADKNNPFPMGAIISRPMGLRLPKIG